MVARVLAAAREAGLEVTVWFTPGGGMVPLPDVFTAMPWNSDSLLAETRTRLAHVETVEHARAERLLT